MSASPFRATSGPFVEVPVPVSPDSLPKVSKDLEDVPFASDLRQYPSGENSTGEASQAPVRRAPAAFWNTLISRLFSARAERRLREEMLSAELQDLRASYAGLLHSTEDIRDQMEAEKESQQTVAKALSPFPAAFAGIEKLRNRQEEASEVLVSIKDRLDTSSDRDKSLLGSMDSIGGGVDQLQSEVRTIQTSVSQVSEGLSELAACQLNASTSLSNFDNKLEDHFEEAAEVARNNAKSAKESSDDVLQMLRQMERNSQRGLWVFASLVAVLFIVLVCLSAKMSQLSGAGSVSSQTFDSLVVEEGVDTGSSLGANEAAAQVLLDDLEF